MSGDYISREALRNALYEEDAITMKGVSIINQFPTADVVERKHGEWIWARGGNTPRLRCSACLAVIILPDMVTYLHPYNFCPNCGAIMEQQT